MNSVQNDLTKAGQSHILTLDYKIKAMTEKSISL